jgi:hypothetical protein
MEPDPRRGDYVRRQVPDLACAVVAGVAVRFRWWMPSAALGALSTGLFIYGAMSEAGAGWFETRSAGWWVLTTALHLPFLVILVFLVGGLVERLGFYWRGRAPEPSGRLPAVYPTVCVQLPMFNEHAVAQRVIETASKMTWPAGRVQRAGAGRLHRRGHPSARRRCLFQSSSFDGCELLCAASRQSSGV